MFKLRCWKLRCYYDEPSHEIQGYLTQDPFLIPRSNLFLMHTLQKYMLSQPPLKYSHHCLVRLRVAIDAPPPALIAILPVLLHVAQGALDFLHGLLVTRVLAGVITKDNESVPGTDVGTVTAETL